jgi:2-aminoadipate transaminase
MALHHTEIPDLPCAATGAERLSTRSRRVRSSAIRDLLEVARRPDTISLAGGLPDPELLPTDEVLAALATVATRTDALQYGPTQGEPSLRRWIAQHELGGVDPDSVVVTQGAQQALSLVVDALVDPGDEVVVERSSYVGMLQPLRRVGATMHAVSSDRDGLCTLELSRALNRGLRPRLVYVVPTHQNPTGSVLSESRRRHLGRLAAAHGVMVLDDDPYRRLGPDPGPRLGRHVPAELSVQVGSFSKTVAPGLRVGWVHGPDWLIDAVVRLKQSIDLHSSSLSQLALVELLGRDGWLEQHCERLRRTYRHRSEVLVDALDACSGGLLSVEVPKGGMFCWAELDRSVGGSDRLAAEALREGVAIVASSAFDPHGTPGHAARLGFATSNPDQLAEAARRLARAARRCVDTPVATSGSIAGTGAAGPG